MVTGKRYGVRPDALAPEGMLSEIKRCAVNSKGPLTNLKPRQHYVIQ